MIYKEIIACAEGGPTPPPNMDPDAYYVGIYDDNGTILCEFFDSKAEAKIAFDRLPFPYEVGL